MNSPLFIENLLGRNTVPINTRFQLKHYMNDISLLLLGIRCACSATERVVFTARHTMCVIRSSKRCTPSTCRLCTNARIENRVRSSGGTDTRVPCDSETRNVSYTNRIRRASRSTDSNSTTSSTYVRTTRFALRNGSRAIHTNNHVTHYAIVLQLQEQ